MKQRMTGDELRRVRRVLGLTSEALAQRLAVRPDTYRKWESGGDPIPYGVPANLLAVAQARSGELDDLIASLKDRIAQDE